MLKMFRPKTAPAVPQRPFIPEIYRLVEQEGYGVVAAEWSRRILGIKESPEITCPMRISARRFALTLFLAAPSQLPTDFVEQPLTRIIPPAPGNGGQLLDFTGTAVPLPGKPDPQIVSFHLGFPDCNECTIGTGNGHRELGDERARIGCRHCLLDGESLKWLLVGGRFNTLAEKFPLRYGR